MMKNTTNTSRRAFLASGTMASIGLLLASQQSFASQWAKPNSKFKGVQIGAITYSYRGMPGSIQEIISYLADSGVSATELMGDAVEEFAGRPKSPIQWRPGVKLTDEQRAQMAVYQKEVAAWRETASLDKYKEVRAMLDQAGIKVYAYKPNAFGPNNSDAEVEHALKAAKVLGASSVTLELPTDLKHTQRLGDLGAKHGVYFGYHAHLQATDTAWDAALAQSPYNSLNLDCGHYIAAGGPNTKESLLALIAAKHDRISSMHIKDRLNKENGGKNMPWGEGNTPLKEILTLLKEKKYKFPATIELEYDIPAGSNAVKEVKICVEYAKKILV